MKTALNYYQDIFNADIQIMEEGIGRISPASRPLAGYIRILISVSHIYQGDVNLAEEQIKKASLDIFPSESLLAKMNWFIVMASVLRLQGRLNQSEKTIEDAFVFLNRRNSYDTPLKFLLYLPKALIFYHRNELDKALEYGLASLRYTEPAGNIDCLLQGYNLLSLIFIAKGNHEKALQYTQKIRSLSSKIDQPVLSEYANNLAAILSIGQGNVGFALKWECETRLQMTEPFSINFIIKAMTLASVHLIRGKLPQVIDLLEKLRDRCAKRNLKEILLNIDMLLSGALWMCGRKESAMQIMKKALLFSETQGYIRPFANCSRLILPLLEDMAKNSPEFGDSVHFNTLFAACGGKEKKPSLTIINEKDVSGYGLTEREFEILKLLADGHKNREIADISFISVNTVKTHTQNIFKKLGVKSRLQAIVQSQNLKLLNKESLN